MQEFASSCKSSKPETRLYSVDPSLLKACVAIEEDNRNNVWQTGSDEKECAVVVMGGVQA
jgi:hypothetical protein